MNEQTVASKKHEAIAERIKGHQEHVEALANRTHVKSQVPDLIDQLKAYRDYVETLIKGLESSDALGYVKRHFDQVEVDNGLARRAMRFDRFFTALGTRLQDAAEHDNEAKNCRAYSAYLVETLEQQMYASGAERAEIEAAKASIEAVN